MPPAPALRPPVREALLQAAIDVFARNPGAPLEAVVRRAGVGRATLFRLFPQRVDLVRAAGLRALADIEAALDALDLGSGTERSRLARLLEVLVPAGVKVHFVFVVGELLEDPALASALKRLDARIVPVIAGAVKAGVIAPDVPEAWLEDAFEALLYAAWLSVSKGRVAAQDAPRLLEKTLLRGLAPRRRGLW